MAVMDVCGAPALTARVVRGVPGPGHHPDGRGDRRSGQERLAVPGGRPRGGRRAGRSGSSPSSARRSCCATPASPTRGAGRRPRPGGCRRRGHRRPWAPADITVVCVDVPGCEHGAILATAEGGTVIFFSMATSFTAAALGAEGLAADVTMLIGNGYTPGHAAYALDLLRTDPAIRALFEARLAGEQTMKLLLRGGPVYAPSVPGATAMLVVDGVIAWIGTGGRGAGAPGRRGRRRRPRRGPGGPGVRRRPRAPHRHRADPAGPGPRGVPQPAGPARRARHAGAGAAGSPDPRPRVGRDPVGRPDVPTREELDRATCGSVVYLSRVDVHSALVSSALVALVPRLRAARGFEDSGRVTATPTTGCAST